MVFYAKLEEGDELQEGDELLYSFAKEWKPIPKTWVGNILTYKEENTLGRLQYPVRRSFTIEQLAILLEGT